MIQGGTLEVLVVAHLILEEEATAAAVAAVAVTVLCGAQGLFNTCIGF